jgi:ABC-type molybdate transport system substrate-binding protein
MRLLVNRSSVGYTSTLWLALFLTSSPAVTPAPAETVTIAAGADLTYCIEDLNRSYQQSHPDTELKLSIGSSGNFSTQIQNGAPFDVFYQPISNIQKIWRAPGSSTHRL